MNYPYPIPNAQANTTTFVANSTGVLGSYDKALDENVFISVDYSQLVSAVTLLGYSFRVSPGGSPQLGIPSSQLTPSTLLTVELVGGIGGRAYMVTINAVLSNGDTRSDVLTVNVLGDDDCGCVTVSPLPPTYGVVSNDGVVVVNTAPRFFVSSTAPVQAQALDRWFDSSTGDVYDFISDGKTGYWVLSIVAAGPSGDGSGSEVAFSGSSIIKLVSIVPDGTTTTFTLVAAGGQAVSIVGVTSLFVSVDGVWQEPGAQYVADGNQITFVQAPSADSSVFMLWFSAPSSGSGSGGENIIAIAPIVPDGTTTSFFMTSASGPVNVIGSNTLFVSVDGVWQEPLAQYTASINTINFVQAPSADSYIFMLWFSPPGS